MKTEQTLKQQIENLIAETKELSLVDGKDKKAYASARRKMTAIRKQVAHITFCLKYIQTKPDEQFIKKESDRLSNRISLFMKTYKPLDAERFKKSDLTAHKKAYEKEMGIPKVKKQLSVLNFLLG